jgi:hypothetical protein
MKFSHLLLISGYLRPACIPPRTQRKQPLPFPCLPFLLPSLTLFTFPYLFCIPLNLTSISSFSPLSSSVVPVPPNPRSASDDGFFRSTSLPIRSSHASSPPSGLTFKNKTPSIGSWSRGRSDFDAEKTDLQERACRGASVRSSPYPLIPPFCDPEFDGMVGLLGRDHGETGTVQRCVWTV